MRTPIGTELIIPESFMCHHSPASPAIPGEILAWLAGDMVTQKLSSIVIGVVT